jgi:hypothetical protein
MDIEEMLGAVYGWGYLSWCHVHIWTLLYWPVTDSARCRSQCPSTRPRPGQAGYRDGRRGRHWDRRRK